MPEHVDILDPEIHEPKGVAAAANGTTYVANGAGSGSWTNPKLTGQVSATANEVPVSDGAGGVAFKTLYTQGFEDDNHAGSSQSITAATWTDLNNDAAGSFTQSTYRLPGKTDVWDTGNNEFHFGNAGYALGDTVDIRVDITVTTTVANQTARLKIDLAHGTGSEYTLEFHYQQFKTAGTYEIIRNISIYIGDTPTLNNPAKIAFRSDSSATVQVNGWYTRVIPRNPILN